MSGRKLIEDMTGVHRVERKEVRLDANGFEEAVTFFFEKMGVE